MPFTPQDLARWREAIQQPPRTPRVPLWLGGHPVGSVEPSTWQHLIPALMRAGHDPDQVVKKTEQTNQHIYAVEPDFIINFGFISACLSQAGAAGPWRDEALPVHAPDGSVCAHVERSAVRVLGVATQAVHLVGWRSDGCLWLQQRAHTKPNDPGLWDTLMGGTVSAGETVSDTLARETWEEAGLRLPALTGLKWGGRFMASRHVPDGGGAGYLLEDTHWYTVQVPDSLVPCNQDGEVDHFEAWSPAVVADAMRAGLFTHEACWVLAQVLTGT